MYLRLTTKNPVGKITLREIFSWLTFEYSNRNWILVDERSSLEIAKKSQHEICDRSSLKIAKKSRHEICSNVFSLDYSGANFHKCRNKSLVTLFPLFQTKNLSFNHLISFSEEVFNTPEAIWFSPSGTYLAVASFNDTNVESAEYQLFGEPSNQYAELVTFKYPKVGA